MRFIPLDLDNFTAISQQVDDVIAQFKELAGEGSGEVETLKDAICERLVDLENFYYENDMDERAILFEKQRLKLRKMIRDYEDGRLVLTEAAPAQTSSARQPQSKQPRRPGSRSSKAPPSDGTLVRSSAVRDKKLKVAPIYDWELKSRNKTLDAEEERVRPDAPPEGFEFQVKLTREEFMTLMERRETQSVRGKSFLQKGQGKMMSSVIKRPIHDEEGADGQFVTSQGPYIEPTYFDNWRDTNKGKWVAKNDFKRTGLDERQQGPDKNAQANDFLNQGPYIENSFGLRGEDKNKWVADETFRRHC
eukprot:TRINITY_DN1186_c0_g1_i1.p1 TRINITY_DN1186_c0_g1~~TRINITY_DN1186_c0_g1_i1.p1  ORF type:complete len:305 (+),score=77.37 TRINITY_DN1186_c0_g1_i1:197-1111(+)